jgi:hypothetical protein
MTALLVLFLLFTALALAAVRWGADTRVSSEWRWAPSTGAAQGAGPVAVPKHAVGRAWAEQVELQERLALLNRPWEEEFLHWSGEGPDRRLHGSVPPPAVHRRHSVTSRGWCPGSGTGAEAGA